MLARRIIRRPDGSRSMTIFPGDGTVVIPGSHPNFDEIVEAVDAGAEIEEIEALADVATAVATKLESLSERVKVDVPNGLVYFDGDKVHDALARHILRALDEGASFQALINFWEKLAQNPQPHSRDQLYEWLDRREFTIAPDGDFFAYKGCAEENGTAVSISRGAAIVDGKPVNGAVPNPIGAVVEFPRSEVAHDPSRGCAKGLHVGDYDYASSWAHGVLLLVKVNPRDVVSVPTDSNAAKVRVCRYEVSDRFEAEAPLASSVYDEDPDDFDDSNLW